VNLQAYGTSGVLDTLSEAELIGLVPFILDRNPREELVIIATFGGEPRAWTTWPLAALGSGETRRSLARDWAGNEFDQLYLIGYGTDILDTAVLINRLHTELATAGLQTTSEHRNFVVDSRQWGFAAYGGQLDGYEGTGTVVAPDPARGRAEGLLFRAACRKRYAAARLRPLDPSQGEKAARIAARCPADRAKIDPVSMAEADAGRYRDALADPSALSLLGAVALGIAADEDAGFAADAMDGILDGQPGALEVWTWVARCSTGTARATASALAALAAWQDGDEAATAFAEIALDAEAESGLAWAVWHLMNTGAAPEHARTNVRADLETVAA
jgi:hypothetical protein